MRRVVLVLSALALAAALVGSAGGASGFKRHSVPEAGVSLSVPASWVVISSKLPPALVDRLLRDNPKLAPFMQSLRSPSSPTKFIALDPAVRKGFATNVNVVVAAVPSWMTFPYYRKALPLEIRNIAQGPVQQRAMTIHGARAVRLLYHLPLHFGGRSFTVQTLQYAFLRKGRSVVVTYTTLPALAGRYARMFSSSAATIRFSGA
jgi:hypothetical protein